MMNEFINVSQLNYDLLEIQRNADSNKYSEEQYGEGIVLLKNYSQGTTSSGRTKFTGTIANIAEMKFNVWNNSVAYTYFEQLPVNVFSHVVWVSYSLSRFGLVITDINRVYGYEPDSFIYHKYNADEKLQELYDTLYLSNITDSAWSVLNEILHLNEYDDVRTRLLTEYAAYSYHDNCESGLIAHLIKCVRIYNGISGAYPFLADEKINDLMVIGLLIHDIGKIYEMYDGVYQKNSYLTHRVLGLKYLCNFEQMIVELYDEDFFDMLCSIISQHHGEHGEYPRTLYAMLVHMIDNLEAQLTTIDTIFENNAITVDAAGAKIKFNNTYLNVLP